jgi:hypothetical protein
VRRRQERARNANGTAITFYALESQFKHIRVGGKGSARHLYVLSRKIDIFMQERSGEAATADRKLIKTTCNGMDGIEARHGTTNRKK